MSQETNAPSASGSSHPAGPPAAPSGRSGDRRNRRSRGVVFWVGVALMLGGLGALGYVAWQFYGTNIVSKQKHQDIVQDLEREWSAAGPTTLDAAEGKLVRGEAGALIRIPAFGDDYVIPVLEGVGEEELASGFGHFPTSAGPGEIGNYALAAHRVTHGEPLRNMPALRPGNKVVVETRDAVYTYVLDTDPNDLVVTFEDVWVVDPLPKNPDGGVQPRQRKGQKLITLTTCAEIFHTDNRMIAFGHLAQFREKQPPPAR